MEERLDDELLRRWLQEDAPHGDLTTRSLGLQAEPATLVFRARGAMRVALTEEAVRLFELCGAQAQLRLASGADAAAGAELLRAQGRAGALLLAWKVAQTGVEVASGMASEAAHIVALLRAAGHRQPLACTRKTPPGLRALACRAVTAGGAVMHRLGLSESLLVFPEHRLWAPAEGWAARLAAVRQAQPEKRLVVEVGSLEDALASAEVLQLERFAPAQLLTLRQTLQAAGLQPLLAPAGGVTAANAVAYAEAGADFLVSSAPYHAAPCDVQVVFSAAPAQG